MAVSLLCDCGKQIVATEGMAGSSITCDCGRTLLVPGLTEMRGGSGAGAEMHETAAEVVARFHRTLVEFSPRALVTPTLIGCNIAVFVIMVASGVNPMQPTIEDLINWGADFGPKTVNGQWWRLLTSTFIHIGLIHLLCNLWAFLVVGRLVERLVGSVGFLGLYLISGLFGSLASLYWQPLLVSAGASGAIFGVYGALVGILFLRRDTIPAEALKELRASGTAFVGYNLVYGLFMPNVDVAAHLGGLAAGFCCGLALSQPISREALARRPARNLRLAIGGSLLLLAGILLIPKGLTDLQGELLAFDRVEKKAIDTYNAMLIRTTKGEASEAELATVLERDVLPDWRVATKHFSTLTGLPAVQQPLVAMLVDYLQARQKSWELLVESIRENDRNKAKQSEAQAARAEQALQLLILVGTKKQPR
jgi:membrane associated rhomboid family serine protease